MDDADVAAAKRRAAESAAESVADGDVVGLGTGSTAARAIDALGRAVDRGLELRGVPTSYQSSERAREAGIPLADLADVDGIDVAVDGADEVALAGSDATPGDEAASGDDATATAPGSIHAIKGGGAAHAREKVVDAAADRLLLVVDERKVADELSCPVPVEVLPFAEPAVADRLRALDGDPSLRAAERKDGPVVTDNGNVVLDCAFGAVDAPADLAAAIGAIPGVVAHGLFVDLADEVHVGRPDGVTVRTA